MRRSLEDTLKNAFEETTMKNVPIDQFQNYKWRNGVQNWNLRKKLSKIGIFENFNFWSKVNAKVKVNELSQSQRVRELDPDVRGGSVQVNGQLGDVVLTKRHYWRGKLTWLITWLGLTGWWRQLRLTCHLMMSSGTHHGRRQMKDEVVFRCVDGCDDVW